MQTARASKYLNNILCPDFRHMCCLIIKKKKIGSSYFDWAKVMCKLSYITQFYDKIIVEYFEELLDVTQESE